MQNDNIRINKICSAEEIADRVIGNVEIKDGVKHYKACTKEGDIIKRQIASILIKKLSNAEFNKIMEIINNSDEIKKLNK